MARGRRVIPARGQAGDPTADGGLRPAHVCRELLRALEAAEGRRRRRKRDTTPDAIGLGIKRTLLESAVADDPEPEAFEGWLLARCVGADAAVSTGAMRMMALDVLAEWRLARTLPDFRAWLDRGAPSDDAPADDARLSRSRAEGPDPRGLVG